MMRVTARVSDLAKRWESSRFGVVEVLKADTRGRISGSVPGSTRSYEVSEVLGSALDKNSGPLSQLVCLR